MEEQGIKKLHHITNMSIEQLSQKERLKAGRVRETMNDIELTNQQLKNGKDNNKVQLQLVIAFSPILKSSLQRIQYCLIDRPTMPANLNKEQIRRRFVDLVSTLRDKLSLPSSYRNLYNKNGKKLSTIVQVAEGDYSFFISPMPSLDILFNTSMDNK